MTKITKTFEYDFPNLNEWTIIYCFVPNWKYDEYIEKEIVGFDINFHYRPTILFNWPESTDCSNLIYRTHKGNFNLYVTKNNLKEELSRRKIMLDEKRYNKIKELENQIEELK